MDQPSASTTHTATSTPPPPRLFNDVHFQRWEPPAPRHVTPWASFARLPPELRRYLWLVCLRRHRMIELDLSSAADEDAAVHSGSRHYSDRNALGNIVSGRGYVLTWTGRRQGPAAGAYSPLLWVSREARQATLSFYRVQLPFFGLQRDQVLYLNPKYDVVSVQPLWEVGLTVFNAHILLVDFLHDMRAYDRKGQDIIHLALQKGFFNFDWRVAGSLPFQLIPSDLHPIAAMSFTNILQRILRSILFIIRFRTCYRGLGEWPPGEGYQYHFAQTLPLARREHPAGGFQWLETDPRPGVDIDIRQLPLGEDPRIIVRCWKQLEQAFGITRAAEQPPPPGARGMIRDAGRFRLYVCPRLFWPKYEREEMLRMERGAALLGLTRPTTMPAMEENEAEGEGEAPGPRAELARHLREEAADWLRSCTWIDEFFLNIFPDSVNMPRQGYVLDTETFKSMERLPCTAIGLWLFPAEAFKQPTVPRRFCFDLSPVRPGLFLFEV